MTTTPEGPRDVPRPLAILRGRAAAEALSGCGGAVLLLGALLAAPAVVHATAPWPSLAGWLEAGGWVVYAVAAATVVIVVFRWAAARQGKAEVFADRVVLRKHEGRAETIRFGELDGFDDARGDVVRLLRSHPWPGARTESVPTPDEHGRAALVDALTAAGVARVTMSDIGAAVPQRVDPGPAPRLQAGSGDLRRAESLTCAALALGPASLLVVRLSAGLSFEVVVIVLTVSWLVTLVAAVWAHTTNRPVAFFDDRILLGEWDPGVWVPHPTLSWDDLAGWRSDGPRRLRLVLRRGLLAESLGEPSVPTPTAEDRAAVEALLAEKGVPRIA